MRATDLYLNEDEIVNEINMSPGGLQRLASTIDARAGMEFEMIVPNVNVENEPEYEPDMDQDTRSRDFDDIRQFFYDGDYNSRRDVDRLMDALQEQFDEWGEEQIFEGWQDEGFEYMREYIETNGYWDDAEANEEATNALQAEYGDSLSPEEFQTMLEQLVKEKFDEFVQQQWDDQDQFYDEALDQYRDEQRGDQSEREWLDENYPYMSDISQNFDIQWPYYIDINDNGGELDVHTVASEFEDAIGKPVNASSSYHGARREAGHYVVEPDGSLDADDSDDGGLEFVSPPMPIAELLDDLAKVKAWADDRGCYTNNSTGLHINVSVPNFSLQALDYVKLALLLGDKYILDQYGRSSNVYCKSALDKVKGYIKQKPDDAKQLLDQMRGHLKDLATKAIHSGSTDKYTSINTKTGYIEFRSPGGDWLNANFDKIKDSLLRFTVALDAALDPNKYREEYLKKLYKLLEPTAVETKNPDTVKYFADYVAGNTPKAALRSFIKQAQLERKLKRGEVDPNTKFWWRVYKDGKNSPNTAIVELIAKTKEEAQDIAAADWGNANNPARRGWDAEPIRPADQTPVRARSGEPQPVGQQSGRYTYRVFTTDTNQTVGTFQSDGIHGSTGAMLSFRNYLRSIGRDSAAGVNYEEIGRQQQSGNLTLGGRPSNPDGNWVIIGNRRPVYRFMAANREDAETVWLQWSSEHRGQDWELQQASQPEFQEPSNSRGNLTPHGPGPWELYRLSSNTSYRALVNRDRTEAEREARTSLGFRGENPADFGVRTRQEQPAPPTGAGREFAGWRVLLPSGEEVYRFSGVGNSQADANRIAAEWLRNNGMGVSGEGFEVVPVWREA